MASLGSFNPQDHSTEQADYSTLPLGIYELEVTASDVVPTKAGNGTILKLTYSVIRPEAHSGRLIFGNMNIENANATAQEIGQRELSMLCRATGLTSISDSQELHLISFTAKVGLEKPQPGYAQRNKITKFFYPDEGNLPEPAIDANQPAAPAAANDNKPAAAPARTAAPAATGSRPWGKK